MRIQLAGWLAVVLTGCSPSEPPAPAPAPAPAEVEMVRAVDLDPDADVVEVSFVAEPASIEYVDGKTTAVRIAPGKRYDVLVTPAGTLDSEIALITRPVDRGVESADDETRTVLTLRFEGNTPEPMDGLAAEDVVDVPAGSTLRVAVRYERPGSWMFHSNIPEHAEAGMMRVLDLD